MRNRRRGLKALIEKRAHLGGEEARLVGQVAAFTADLNQVREGLAACDARIRELYALADPNRIKPKQQHVKSFTGKRGDMRTAIVDCVRAEAPRCVSTVQVAAAVVEKFGLVFPSRTKQMRWAHDSVGKQLKTLAAENLIERDAEPVPIGEPARWRWKSGSGPSADRLLELMLATGESVHESDDGPE